jgi:hypothetical protein
MAFFRFFCINIKYSLLVNSVETLNLITGSTRNLKIEHSVQCNQLLFFLMICLDIYKMATNECLPSVITICQRNKEKLLPSHELMAYSQRDCNKAITLTRIDRYRSQLVILL